MLYDCKRRPTPHASFSLSMRGLTGSRFPHVPGFHNLRADVCMKDPKALVLSLALIRYHCMDRILELLPSMPMALQIKRLEAGGWRLDLSQSCANAPLREVNRQQSSHTPTDHESQSSELHIDTDLLAGTVSGKN